MPDPGQPADIGDSLRATFAVWLLAARAKPTQVALRSPRRYLWGRVPDRRVRGWGAVGTLDDVR